MYVRDAMVRNVVAADRGMTLSEGAWLMLSQNLEALPVVDDARRLEGVVSQRDCFELIVLRRAGGRGDASAPIRRRQAHPRLAEVMRAPAVTVTAEHRLHSALEFMLDARAEALPVVADERLVGMLTRRSVLDAWVTDACRFHSFLVQAPDPRVGTGSDRRDSDQLAAANENPQGGMST